MLNPDPGAKYICDYCRQPAVYARDRGEPKNDAYLCDNPDCAMEYVIVTFDTLSQDDQDGIDDSPQDRPWPQTQGPYHEDGG